MKSLALLMSLQKKTVKLNNFSYSCNTLVSFSHRCGIDKVGTLFLYPSQMQVQIPFIIPFAIIMALRPQVYYLQTIMRTGENYFFFHFDITFVTVQINSVPSGNTYSYSTLRNMLCNSTLTSQYSGTRRSFQAPLFITFLDKPTSLLGTN